MNNFDKYIYRVLSGLVVVMIATGTIFYHIVEKFSFVDAYYFSVVTLATVGYGDLSPKTTTGKIFTTAYIFVGVGIITAYLGATARRRGEKLKRRQTDKQTDKTK